MLIMVVIQATILQAQIYEPDGVRMPGDWNGWANNTGMGGVFDLQKIRTGNPRWQTTFQHTGATGSAEFKFVSTGFGDPWGNQWAGNSAITVDGISELTYGTPSDPNNKVNLQQNHWYTVTFEDKGYTGTRIVFMQTTAEPVMITTVIQQPLLVSGPEPVNVSVQLSANPSPEEKFYLRYTLNAWNESFQVPVAMTGNSGTAVIPPYPNDTTVEYYIYSTVINDPQHDFDLFSIRLKNNEGLNYSYTVGETITCGNSLNLISTEPAFPQENIPLNLYFNAEFGNGGLFNYTGDVYAHTGVITNLSTSGSDWKYVKTEWGQNTPETKLTRLEPNLYSLQINNIRQYYGIPVAEQIKKLAFVFRGGTPYSTGNYPEHKNADGTDIFIEIYIPSLRVRILNPSSRDPLASPDQIVPVCVEAIQNQNISIYLDNLLLKTETTSSLAYPLVLQGFSPGTYWVKAVAEGESGKARDSVSIYLRGPVVTEALPAGVGSGINYIDQNTVTLVLHDPAGLKNFAFATGEYSNWLPNDQNYMKRTPDGHYFWVTLTGLVSQKEYAYQYYIDGKLKVADPFCDKILDPWNDRWIPKYNYPNLKSYPFDKTSGTVSVFQTNQTPYTWEITGFTPPALNETQQDLMIYELLLRDFTDSSSIVSAMGKLDYLNSLGVNAIELMPVNDFDGNDSWGYGPNFFFAPDKYYGKKQDYKKFIDECHKRGIAVILDLVMNHCFGQSPMALMYFDPATGSGQPLPQNPWLNTQAPHPLSVGYDFNHESPYTRDFFKKVLQYWLTEYNVDGFRFDLSKGLTQKYTGSDLAAWSLYDQGRINILNDYYQHIKSVKPNAYVILEHFAENNEEVSLANAGMMLWSAMHNQYKQTGIGWPSNSDLSRAYHGNRGFTYPNLIDYMENHDEERIMYEALAYGNSTGGYNLKDTATALHHQQMAAVLMMGIPGPKMVWQFGELGYDYSIMFNGGRTSRKPPRWDYLGQPERQKLYHTYSAMAKLRKRDAFRFGNFTGDLSGAGKRMWIAHSSMNVVIAANMDVSGFSMTPGFQHAGNWFDYFSGETVNITDPAGHSFSFAPGEFRVFTDVKLDKPFHQLSISISDSTDLSPVEGAEIQYEGVGSYFSDPQGNLLMYAFPGIVRITILKQGFKPYNRIIQLQANQSLNVLLQRDSNYGTVQPGSEGISIYPNPANEQVTIEADHLCTIALFSPDGRMLLTRRMESPRESISLRGLQKGLYLIHLSGEKGSATRKIILD